MTVRGLNVASGLWATRRDAPATDTQPAEPGAAPDAGPGEVGCQAEMKS